MLTNPLLPIGDRPLPRDLIRFDVESSVEDWSSIDDRVMGGVSNSRLRYEKAGYALFEGVVSLDRNGGFASVRSRPFDLGMPGATCYWLEVKGDGKRYKLNLRTDDGFDGLNYQAVFAPPEGPWTTIELPVQTFKPSFRGRSVEGAAPLDPMRVRQVGLMIADRQEGNFSLALRSIQAR